MVGAHAFDCSPQCSCHACALRPVRFNVTIPYSFAPLLLCSALVPASRLITFCSLVFFESGSGTAVGSNGNPHVVEDRAAQAQTTTKLFWPFSSWTSNKISSPASEKKPVQASRAAKSPDSNDDSKLEAKAVRHAEEVMRKLAREDEQAARKAADENVRLQPIDLSRDRSSRILTVPSVSQETCRSAHPGESGRCQGCSSESAISSREQGCLR